MTTVRTHLNKIYEKIGPMNRVELALYAVTQLTGATPLQITSL